MVGASGFEPPASWSQPGALARLRYAPNVAIPSASQFTPARLHSQPTESSGPYAKLHFGLGALRHT